jgi:uncharacterized alpha-E superfamily protein
VDGDHFEPNGFGVGLAATVGVGFVAAALQAGNNVAQVMREHREQEGWDRINETMQGLVEENASLRRKTAEWAATVTTIGAQFKVVADLAVSQAQKLKALRDRGVVID